MLSSIASSEDADHRGSIFRSFSRNFELIRADWKMTGNPEPG
jgi:hypothetical protein